MSSPHHDLTRQGREGPAFHFWQRPGLRSTWPPRGRRELTKPAPGPYPKHMPTRLLHLGSVLVLAALLQICGGHWLVLQTVAWGEMIVDYTRDASLLDAVGKTFDGEHPCALCQTIDQGKKSERHVPAELAKVKPVCVLLITSALVRRVGIPWELALPRFDGELRFEQPAVPPPQRA